MALSSGNIGKYEFLTGKDVLAEKGLLEKAATVKRFGYSTFSSELKKQTDIAKDQYKFYKDQMNVNNNNREDRVEVENDEIKDNVYNRYVCNEYKCLINRTYEHELKIKTCISQILIIELV